MKEWHGCIVCVMSPGEKQEHWQKMLDFWDSVVKNTKSAHWKRHAGSQVGVYKNYLEVSA